MPSCVDVAALSARLPLHLASTPCTQKALQPSPSSGIVLASLTWEPCSNSNKHERKTCKYTHSTADALSWMHHTHRCSCCTHKQNRVKKPPNFWSQKTRVYKTRVAVCCQAVKRVCDVLVELCACTAGLASRLVHRRCVPCGCMRCRQWQQAQGFVSLAKRAGLPHPTAHGMGCDAMQLWVCCCTVSSSS